MNSGFNGQPRINWGDDIGPRVAIASGRSAMSGITGCIFSIVITGFIMLTTLCGVGFAFWSINVNAPNSSSTSYSGVDEWDGKSTFKCGGNDSFELEGMKVNMKKGTAIKATGNCRLSLDEMKIKAPTAIKASGNAKITVSGGTIEGKKKAFSGSTNSRIILEDGAKLIGKVKTSGNSKVIEEK